MIEESIHYFCPAFSLFISLSLPLFVMKAFSYWIIFFVFIFTQPVLRATWILSPRLTSWKMYFQKLNVFIDIKECIHWYQIKTALKWDNDVMRSRLAKPNLDDETKTWWHDLNQNQNTFEMRYWCQEIYIYQDLTTKQNHWHDLNLRKKCTDLNGLTSSNLGMGLQQEKDLLIQKKFPF